MAACKSEPVTTPHAEDVPAGGAPAALVVPTTVFARR